MADQKDWKNQHRLRRLREIVSTANDPDGLSLLPDPDVEDEEFEGLYTVREVVEMAVRLGARYGDRERLIELIALKLAEEKAKGNRPDA